MLEIYINIRESKEVHEASSPLHKNQKSYSMTNFEKISKLSSSSKPLERSNKNEERALLFIHEFKISDHNYISTILSTYPLKFSTNRQLIPPNPQPIYNSSL